MHNKKINWFLLWAIGISTCVIIVLKYVMLDKIKTNWLPLCLFDILIMLMPIVLSYIITDFYSEKNMQKRIDDKATTSVRYLRSNSESTESKLRNYVKDNDKLDESARQYLESLIDINLGMIGQAIEDWYEIAPCIKPCAAKESGIIENKIPIKNEFINIFNNLKKTKTNESITQEKL